MKAAIEEAKSLFEASSPRIEDSGIWACVKQRAFEGFCDQFLGKGDTACPSSAEEMQKSAERNAREMERMQQRVMQQQELDRSGGMCL